MQKRSNVYQLTNYGVWDKQHTDVWLRFRHHIKAQTSNRIMSELRKETTLNIAITKLYEASNSARHPSPNRRS